ncbi:Transposase IS200 like protein [Aquisphaera giovannonii]|uniref:Transposase IS200 like protein n=1 Tax=Aquisphaera giovannonii TaxID=406548 RepID=A0A5B9W8R9_9BACT|nr:transposase [Aquisphaera giovannonii]QEH36421.1 Transposase IS200 like protein [Aquisphaera giovannonii]
MPRTARKAPAGLIYHVLNRSVGRMRLFRSDADFEAFERVVIEAFARCPLPVLSYCVMSNHWHFVVRPRTDHQVTDFFRWLAHTHAMRWRVARRTAGYGHLYQGRFKCFPVQSDDHLLTVLRYVERNPVGPGLVERAERWRRGSLWARLHDDAPTRHMLAPWPVACPDDWIERVNAPLGAREVRALKPSLERGRPFGDDAWTGRIVRRLGLGHTIRPEGRLRKEGSPPPGPETASSSSALPRGR